MLGEAVLSEAVGSLGAQVQQLARHPASHTKEGAMVVSARRGLSLPAWGVGFRAPNHEPKPWTKQRRGVL